MRVLSLFDGMSCGRIALERANIPVTEYYASEIDKYATKVSEKNYPDIIRLGDVREVKGEDLPKIDLLLAGSPCQGFSFAGKQLAFDDPRSALFFEFVRILKETKPKYFLLENVKMKKEFQKVITDILEVEPIEINSALVSAQNRKRLYWTNIPNVSQPEDKGIKLKDILEHGPMCAGRIVGRRLKNGKRADSDKSIKPIQRIEINENPQKANCLSTVQKDNILTDKASIKKLTPVDYERLQTIPDNYTEGISNTQRYKMPGNGWTVDVIAHILKNIIVSSEGNNEQEKRDQKEGLR